MSTEATIEDAAGGRQRHASAREIGKLIDPVVQLAMTMQQQPGVYALLIGSGLSRGSGILTGWEVTLDLIKRVAKSSGANANSNEELLDWYREEFVQEPEYSTLIEKLAKTPIERQQFLRSYFEPTEEEELDRLKVPNDAHVAIAELVAGGYVRVIVTTNFDRLIERAIESTGIMPTVLFTPEQIEGSIPLSHSSCTVLKVNGDYLDSRIRNTSNELSAYEQPLDDILDRVFDEYGLVVCGWSAQWDGALRTAIERTKNRRYTTFWTHRNSLRPEVTELCQRRDATTVSIKSGEEFFRSLAESVKSIEELRLASPLEPKVAAQTVKRYMALPRSDIRLFDLLMPEVDKVLEATCGDSSSPLNAAFSIPEILDRLRKMEHASANLMSMFSVAGYFAKFDEVSVWAAAWSRLANMPQITGSVQPPYDSIRMYPALLAMYCAGIASVFAGRLGFATSLMLVATMQPRHEGGVQQLAFELWPNRVLDSQFTSYMTEEERFTFRSLGDHLRASEAVRESVRQFIVSERDFLNAFDGFEFVSLLVRYDRSGELRYSRSDMWGRGISKICDSAVFRRIADEIEQQGEQWPPLVAGAFNGSLDQLNKVMKQVGEERFTRYL